MRKTQRLVSVAAIAATALSLAACGSSEEPSSGGGASSAASGGGASSAAPSSAASGGGSQAAAPFGPGCGDVPPSGEGSAEGMVDDPVGTAAGNNPLVKTTADLVGKAGLAETLNDTSASFTVFAPANDAYEAADTKPLVPTLQKDTAMLKKVLTYHVAPKEMDKDQLQSAGTVKTVAGGELKIGGSGDNMTVTDAVGRSAKVLCGNVQTANAKVFVIDKVLLPMKP